MALSTGSKILATDVAPKSHANSATTYGIGTGSNYGHVKLSDSTNSTSAASSGIAASPKAVKAAYDLANGKQDKLGYTPVKSVNGTVADSAGNVNVSFVSNVSVFDEEGNNDNTTWTIPSGGTWKYFVRQYISGEWTNRAKTVAGGTTLTKIKAGIAIQVS